MPVEQLAWFVVGSAILSSALTLLAVGLYAHLKLAPMIEKRIEDHLQASMTRLEDSFRKRIIEALAAPSDVLRERALGLAKTGFDLFSAKKTDRPDRKKPEENQ